MNEITREQVKQALDEGDAIIVDAREADSYRAGHIPGAVSIPPDEADDLAPDLLKDKNARIITYCGNTSCPLSGRLAESLRSLGYSNVSEFSGGKEDWAASGFPLETGVNPAPANLDRNLTAH